MPVEFFNAQHPMVQKLVPPVETQNIMESRRLWRAVAEAITQRDHTLAAEHKSVLEEEQRRLAKVRDDNGLDWQPNFFRLQGDGQWVLVEKNMYIPLPWYCASKSRLGSQKIVKCSSSIWMNSSAAPISSLIILLLLGHPIYDGIKVKYLF